MNSRVFFLPVFATYSPYLIESLAIDVSLEPYQAFFRLSICLQTPKALFEK